MTKYEVIYTPNFKRDFKLIQKRGYDLGLLKDVITKLANGEELPTAKNYPNATATTH